MARGNDARQVTAGRDEAVFKATEGRAVCVSTVSTLLFPRAVLSPVFRIAFARVQSVRLRGFGLFGNLGRQNIRSFIGRALFNGGGFVGFEVGKRFSWSFCGRALGRAVLD